MANNHDKHHTQRFFADRWYRFNRYEIKGDYIQPAADAVLTAYEPWQSFHAPEGKEGHKQPYEPLLQLARQIDLDYDNLRVRGKDEEPIVEWCAQHGLLGLLLHRVEAVILPPQERVVPFFKEPRQPRLWSTKYVRTNSGWSSSWVNSLSAADHPGVLIRDLGGFDLKFEKLSETWGSHFPAVPLGQQDNYQYPGPFTQEFWRQYAEPVVVFVEVAKMFLSAVDVLTKLRTRSRPSPGQITAGLSSIEKINALTTPVRPMLYRGEKRYVIGWACHSLLAAYSMMVVQDLARARLLECANASCKKFFVTKAEEAKYCSPTCRGTVQVRKYRRKQSRAFALLQKGRSPLEIANTLRIEVKLVQGWVKKWRVRQDTIEPSFPHARRAAAPGKNLDSKRPG
jgi:hypothetical protein